eukprot:TRINITY_DN19925_c0_g1_i2.p1 TRINITY_DN19925_c0_g1~~TRINITY_DN19925_c0_g1_i2.p1  ORF type:complete len:913 (+),score=215.35 TRINITY_DN19925_c0_g1_i2:109-2847(+)
MRAQTLLTAVLLTQCQGKRPDSRSHQEQLLGSLQVQAEASSVLEAQGRGLNFHGFGAQHELRGPAGLPASKLSFVDFLLGFVELSFVVAWIAYFFVKAEKENTYTHDDFFEFEKKTRKLTQISFDVNRFTLCFSDDLLERRFMSIRTDELGRRMALLCLGLLVYTPLVAFSSVDHEGSFILNPASRKILDSQPAFVYFLAALGLMVASLTMLSSLRRSFRVEHSEQLESVTISWLVVVLVTRVVFFSRFYVAKIHGVEDPLTLFASIGQNGGDFTLVYMFLILYLSTFTPLRFRVVGPFIVFVPLLFGSLALVYGSEEDFLKEKKTGEGLATDKGFNAYLMEELVIALKACYKLGCTAAFGLTTKYCNEFVQREAFLKSHKSFEMIQELSASDQDDAAPVTQIRSALAKASDAVAVISTAPEVQKIKKQVGHHLEDISREVDFARQKLQNPNKLFEVKAEDALRKHGSLKENSSVLAYLRQSMGDQHHDDERENAARPEFKKAALPHHDVVAVQNSVAVASTAELAADWGKIWGFEALQLGRKTNNSALLFAGEKGFMDFGNDEVLGVHRDIIRTWTRKVHCRYLPNGYHNEAHAAQVAHFSYWFAMQTGWFEKADGIQKCSLLIASLGHDVGHIGRNNLYCMKASHPFSLIWNDKSSLESMHAATCFSIMTEDADLLRNMDTGSKMRLRSNVIRFILATDIKEHHSSLAKLKGMMEDETFLQSPRDAADKEAKTKFDEDMTVAGETLLKTSDIAHCMLPWEQHKEWSYRVQLEFFDQGDEERGLGLPISPLCERAGAKIAGGQAFFIDHFGKDLFSMLLRFAKPGSPGATELNNCLSLGEANKINWREEEKNFKPELLSMETIQNQFGYPVKDVVYPYQFEALNVESQVSTADNLAQMVMHSRSNIEPRSS